MVGKINQLGTDSIVTVKQLSIILGVPIGVLEKFSETAPRQYHPYQILKADKTKRIISNPNEAMKSLQRKILDKILSRVILPEEFFGGRRHRDIRANAIQHVGKKALVSIDIRDCFPSVSYKRVFRLYREKFAFSSDVARILTNLTTYRRCLPQGGVTSTILLSILLIPLCDKLKLILSSGDNLSFWVDDIAISGDKVHLMCQPTMKALQKFGFSARAKKVKVMFSGERQVLTSLTTNSKLSVVLNKTDLYIEEAINKKAKETTTEGRLAYVRHINPTQERRLRRRIATTLA